MKSILTYILILSILLTCRKKDEPEPFLHLNTHIEYFGFTIIDTFWDDPTDSETKTNYAEEINTFSNIADISVLTPEDNLVQRTQTFTNLNLKAILHLNDLFFELIDSNSPSGSNYDLRSDYQERWNKFRNTNKSILNSSHIGAFYIGEEPTWNGIMFSELNIIAQRLKADFPTIPLMVIEAYPSLNDIQVPELVDWVGFDRYLIKNPNENPEFQELWQVLKSKLSHPSQSIIVVMDSHYIDWAHGDVGHIDLLEMDKVANNYYELAKSEEKVIAILGYFWPNGFDFPESIGARGMPQSVKMEYERIGKEITGKND